MTTEHNAAVAGVMALAEEFAAAYAHPECDEESFAEARTALESAVRALVAPAQAAPLVEMTDEWLHRTYKSAATVAQLGFEPAHQESAFLRGFANRVLMTHAGSKDAALAIEFTGRTAHQSPTTHNAASGEGEAS